MIKKSGKSTKLFVGIKEKDRTVGFGKYKNKTLIWVSKNDFDFFIQIEKIYYSKYDTLKQKYYQDLKIKLLQEKEAHIDILLQDQIQETISLMKDKFTREQIYSHFAKKYNYTTEQTAKIVGGANSLIRKEFDLEKDFLLDIHLIRYEEIFSNSTNPSVDHIQPGYRKAVISEHKLIAMETLFQKERLLGIHSKKFKLQSNIPAEKHQNLDFDLSVLNTEEAVELLFLLNKAKKTEILIKPIIDDNPLNVDITNKVHNTLIEEAPIRQAKQTDIVGDREALVSKSTGKSLFEVQQVMKQTLEEKVRELFEKKNKK